MTKKRHKLTVLLGIIVGIFLISYIIFNITENYYINKKHTGIIMPSNYKIKDYLECSRKYTLYYDDNNNKLEKTNQVCIKKLILTSSKEEGKLKKDLDSIVAKYNSKICRNQNVLYDSNKNITIFKYELTSKNEISIEYMNSNINNDDCKLIKNIEEISYKYDYSYYYPLNPNIRKSFSYIGSDNLNHDVYSDCGDCLTIKNGKGTYETFKTMIRYSYIDMETLVLFLEKQSEMNKATKKINEIGTLYSNDEFQLFVCGSELKNNVYISDKINLSDIEC